MKRISLAAIAALFAITGMAKDIKTAVFTTEPHMHCASCERKIKENIRFEKGVKKIETNLERQTITIQYDADKTNPEKLLKGFERIRYKAKVVNTSAPKEETTHQK